MPTFAVTYTYTDDDAGRDEHRPAHREYLVAQEELRVGSAYADDPAGALLIFTATDLATVRDIVENDPFYLAGLIASYDAREWPAGLGPASSALQ